MIYSSYHNFKHVGLRTILKLVTYNTGGDIAPN